MAEIEFSIITDDEDEACIHAFDEHGLEVENCFSFEENLSINGLYTRQQTQSLSNHDCQLYIV